MPFFLVSTAHLPTQLWFRDREDFAAGMNYVAVATLRAEVVAIAFVLMSNHVHFVLRCTYEQAEAFIIIFKKLYSSYCHRKHGSSGILRRNDADIRKIDTSGEGIEKAIAYVLMNPVSAKICLHPVQYPWGSGPEYFSESTVKGTPIGELSVRRQQSVLHSHLKLPDNYILGHEGYILPGSYIPVKDVEALFKSPSRMHYFLSRSSKAPKNEGVFPSFRDQVLLAAAQDLCMSLFRGKDISLLSQSELAELIRQMHFRFSSDINQIARVVGIPYENAARLLDEYPG